MDDQNSTTPKAVMPINATVESAHHDAPVVEAAPLAPELINGVKVYPTSFLPIKSILHLPKKALVSMEIEHIEGIHIAFFLGLTIFLFIGMWKRQNLR